MKLFTFLVVTAFVAVNATNSLSPDECLNLILKMKFGQICQEDDTDCIATFKSFIQCMENCEKQTKDTTIFISCAEKNCKSTNPTMQRTLADFIQCAKDLQHLNSDPKSNPVQVQA
ncbi:hypothetical protein ABPG74_013054 [Tetrahymena malaccensis]